jgi:bifunctional non-homologous end joining protein LigD
MSLTKYKAKRTFKTTPEPKARRKKSAQELIFVVQKHAASHLHYDLRLELDGVLKSWAVPKGPPKTLSEKRLAIMVEDHPYEYKDFAGVIPEGNYGAGLVEIWDHGTYTIADTESVDEAEDYLRAGLKKGHVSFWLHGRKLKGEFALIRTERAGQKNAWLFIKVGKKKAVKVVAADPMPRQVKPMLAVLIDKPFNQKNWLFEIKWDGYRAIALIRSGKVQLRSRNNLSFNEQFPKIVEALEKHDIGDAILDGEVVLLDEQGRSQFQLMQNYKRTETGNLFYYVFDLLYVDGVDLRGMPLLDRKEKLEVLLSPFKNSAIRYSDHVWEKGVKFFNEAKKHKLEGIMAKNAESTYQEKRSRDWLKIKTGSRQEVVIGGFTAPKGGREYLGALLVGVYAGKSLQYVGKVGTGFSDETLKELSKKLKALVRKTNPFSEAPKMREEITFVRPTLVCEISFTEWTLDGAMRHPVFLGLRSDKKASEVVKEDAHQ